MAQFFIPPYQDSQFRIKLLETRLEIESALRLYARIAVKKNPLIISLSIDSEFYWENYCKFFIDLLLKDNLSVGAYDIKTNKLVCVALSVDLFSEAPKELDLENLHPLMQREEAVCLKGLEEFIKDGIITRKKNFYFYELMAATEDDYAQSKIYYKVSMFRIRVMLAKGFKMYYGELTTPFGIRAWMDKIKPNFLKKIDLVNFEYKGKKVFEGLEWEKMGFQKGEECCHCILKEFTERDLPGDNKPKL